MWALLSELAVGPHPDGEKAHRRTSNDHAEEKKLPVLLVPVPVILSFFCLVRPVSVACWA